MKGPRELIEKRLQLRSNHFMPNHLISSQLNTLEEPSTEENDVIVVNIDSSKEEITNQILLLLEKRSKTKFQSKI